MSVTSVLHAALGEAIVMAMSLLSFSRNEISTLTTVHSPGAIAILNCICLDVRCALTSYSCIHILGYITGSLICGGRREVRSSAATTTYKDTRVKWPVLRPIMRATDSQNTQDHCSKEYKRTIVWNSESVSFTCTRILSQRSPSSIALESQHAVSFK